MKRVVFALFFVAMVLSCEVPLDPAHWSWGDHTLHGICPVNELPLRVSPEYEIRPIVEEAIDVWNEKLGYPAFVIDQAGYPFLVAKETHYKYARICQPVLLGDGTNRGQEWGHSYAWTDFYGNIGSWQISSHLCLKKFLDAKVLMQTKAADAAKRIGLFGFILHELGHYLIGPNHPAWGDLMGSNQRNNVIHPQTISLIRETVIKPCKGE